MTTFEKQTTDESDSTLSWVGDYPVVRNKTVAISLLAVSTISVGLVALFLVGLTVNEGNYQFVPQTLKLMGGIWLGIVVALFLIAQLFFGGKVPVEVSIDQRGITQIQRSKRGRVANLVAVVGGLIAGGARGATTAGAGLLAAARTVERSGFTDLHAAKGNPKTGEIRLWDDWHTVMQIFAPLDRYGEALRRIEQGISMAAAGREPRTDIPTAVKALVSFAAVSLGAFLLVDFPLGFSWLFVLPMVVATIGTILSRPSIRPTLGWLLATAVVVSVAALFLTHPPALFEAGAGLVTGIQLSVIGIFVLFGVCAGRGLFNLRKEPERP